MKWQTETFSLQVECEKNVYPRTIKENMRNRWFRFVTKYSHNAILYLHRSLIRYVQSEISNMIKCHTITKLDCKTEALCHTHCDMVHLWGLTPVTERLALELSVPVFNDLGLSGKGFEHPTFRMQYERSNRLHHYLGLWLDV